ncbi:MAG: DUF1127 domain-containing protein [Pseudomonadota bacterium]
MSHHDLALGRKHFARRTTPFSLRQRLTLWKSRRALAKLDAHALADIGVTAEDALRESRLSVWDVPATWKGL